MYPLITKAKVGLFIAILYPKKATRHEKQTHGYKNIEPFSKSMFAGEADLLTVHLW